MNDSHLTSPLPSVETPQQLTFWQSVGIATQLAACHSYDDQQSVKSFWSRISDRIQKQSLLILFNQEQRPVAFSSWTKPDESGKENDRTIVFTDLVSPFSSPLYFHRFLHHHFNRNGEAPSAKLIAKTEGQPPRKIW